MSFSSLFPFLLQFFPSTVNAEQFSQVLLHSIVLRKMLKFDLILNSGYGVLYPFLCDNLEP